MTTQASSPDALLEQEFKQLVEGEDPALLDQWLTTHPAWGERINLPLFAFGGRAINAEAQNRGMLEVLLKHGADINLKSDWWAGGFGVLEAAPRDIAQWLIGRGAKVDIFAAAKHGHFDRVKELIHADPSLVHARGGDGQRALHYASTPQIVDYLLDHGALIDARCVDHVSTAAQYAVKNEWKPRYLLDRGAGVDIFMAAYLDDVDLIKRAIAEVPDAPLARIGLAGYSPCPNDAAGSIYQWVLGSHLSAIEVAGRYGRAHALAALQPVSGPAESFIAACLMGDDKTARQIVARHPDLTARLSDEDRFALHLAACDANLPAVSVMLDMGFPVNLRRDDGERFTPLDHAAMRGDAAMVELLIERGADVNSINGYGGNTLGVCLWGSVHFKNAAGDYAQTARLLLDAGSTPPKTIFGSPACQAVLRSR